ncbi:hypothetical protein L1987_49737 [Smallanthus sonchifolius]|uniref:Uncharacterized protein n=1 Tax=Smallanthus sonchifolius TaxID=185202 RepID=A0ACB9FW41_9ASTR|nr:hypothetical protein L1987_49737 [Smallanthus sonchifolius]
MCAFQFNSIQFNSIALKPNGPLQFDGLLNLQKPTFLHLRLHRSCSRSRKRTTTASSSSAARRLVAAHCTVLSSLHHDCRLPACLFQLSPETLENFSAIEKT